MHYCFSIIITVIFILLIKIILPPLYLGHLLGRKSEPDAEGPPCPDPFSTAPTSLR